MPSTFGWGAGLSGHFIRVAKDGIYFQANGGYGIGRYATDSGTAPGRFRHLGRRQNAQDRAWSPRGSGRRVSRCLRVDPSGSLLARPTRAEGILRERCRIAQMADRCAKAAIVIAAISSGAHRPRMQRICRRLKRGDTLERRRRFAGRETGRQRDCCRNARASDFHGMFLPSLLVAQQDQRSSTFVPANGPASRKREEAGTHGKRVRNRDALTGSPPHESVI